MSQWRITPRAVKTAWKMVTTIEANASITSSDLNSLLNLTVLIALHDLLDDRLSWRQSLPHPVKLVVHPGRQVRVIADVSGKRHPMHAPTDDAVDHAAGQAEELFDKYSLDDDERDTLFTALPCLGLKALEKQLVWNKKPPFPEVG